MPSYTVHYSNTAESPPIGDPLVCKAPGPDAAIYFAQDNMPSVSHQPSVGDARGFSICDSNGNTIVPWRSHDA